MRIVAECSSCCTSAAIKMADANHTSHDLQTPTITLSTSQTRFPVHLRQLTFQSCHSTSPEPSLADIAHENPARPLNSLKAGFQPCPRIPLLHHRTSCVTLHNTQAPATSIYHLRLVKRSLRCNKIPYKPISLDHTYRAAATQPFFFLRLYSGAPTNFFLILHYPTIRAF